MSINELQKQILYGRLQSFKGAITLDKKSVDVVPSGSMQPEKLNKKRIRYKAS